MTHPDPSTRGDAVSAAARLEAILAREIRLARNGSAEALSELLEEKRDAFAAFEDAAARAGLPAREPTEPERLALRTLAATASENMLALDAVRTAIGDFADRLRKTLVASADPGTYGPRGRAPRHAMAARINDVI